MFGWGATLFFKLSRPPADSMEIVVVGKQWMWKVQHPEGVREINELHVPIGVNIRISLGSEDVIHDFFMPAFRVKMDAVPGKMTTMWFQATQAGHVPHLLFSVLRHEALGHGGPGDGDGAAGLRGVAGGRPRDSVASLDAEPASSSSRIYACM